VDIEIIGANQPANYEIAQRLAGKMTHIPGAVDVHVQQAFDAPTLYMDLDRTRSPVRRYAGARRGSKSARVALLELPDFAEFLAGPEERCQLQRGGANTANTA